MKNIAFIIGDTLPPESLYKFGCFDSERHFVDLIKNNDIYLSCPEDFNDPFDCAIIPDFSQLNDEQFRFIIKDVWESDSSIRASYPQFNNELVSIFRKNQFELAQLYRAHYKKTLGIRCFSEKKDNMLMWSHYARGHRGFCLEFVGLHLKPRWMNMGIVLRRVTYSKIYPKFSLPINPLWSIFYRMKKLWELLVFQKQHSEFTLPKNSSEWRLRWAFKIASTKSHVWNYEKEWRLMHPPGGARKILQYEDADLKSIYLGAGCKEEDIEMFKSLIRNKNPRPKLYKGKMADYKYKIEFEEIANE